MVRVNYPFEFKILPRFLAFVNREFGVHSSSELGYVIGLQYGEVVLGRW